MVPTHDFSRFSVLSTFIVGHSYVTVFSKKYLFEEVLRSVFEFVEEEDSTSLKKPFVYLSGVLCSESHAEFLIENEWIDIVLS